VYFFSTTAGPLNVAGPGITCSQYSPFWRACHFASFYCTTSQSSGDALWMCDS